MVLGTGLGWGRASASLRNACSASTANYTVTGVAALPSTCHANAPCSCTQLNPSKRLSGRCSRSASTGASNNCVNVRLACYKTWQHRLHLKQLQSGTCSADILRTVRGCCNGRVTLRSSWWPLTCLATLCCGRTSVLYSVCSPIWS